MLPMPSASDNIRRMVERFFPDACADSVYAIDLRELRARGMRGIILDADNTLLRPNAKKPDARIIDWLASARCAGFELCVLTNSRMRRADAFAAAPGLHFIPRARKPSMKGYKEALRLMGLESCEVCMVGDQIFTDVYGARRMGMYAIHTKPIVLREVFTVMLKRIPEAFVLWKWQRARDCGELAK